MTIMTTCWWTIQNKVWYIPMPAMYPSQAESECIKSNTIWGSKIHNSKRAIVRTQFSPKRTIVCTQLISKCTIASAQFSPKCTKGNAQLNRGKYPLRPSDYIPSLQYWLPLIAREWVTNCSHPWYFARGGKQIQHNTAFCISSFSTPAMTLIYYYQYIILYIWKGDTFIWNLSFIPYLQLCPLSAL